MKREDNMTEQEVSDMYIDFASKQAMHAVSFVIDASMYAKKSRKQYLRQIKRRLLRIDKDLRGELL